MHATIQKITPFLWFDTQAEDAVNLNTSFFLTRGLGMWPGMGPKLQSSQAKPSGWS